MYLGNQPALSYTSFAKQDFTTSATTSYTLDNPVTNANELALFINFVRQEPTTAYSASGTTLTLTSATSATDDMYCVFLGKAVQTVNPPNASVGASQLVDASITSAKLASGVLPTNSELFLAIKTSNQSISTSTTTLLTWDTERYDTGNNFASNAYTVPSDGYYYLYAKITINVTPPAGRFGISIMSGSTTLADCQNGSAGAAYNSMGTSIIVALSAGDVIDVDCRQTTGETEAVYGGSWNTTVFGGYKLNT